MFLTYVRVFIYVHVGVMELLRGGRDLPFAVMHFRRDFNAGDI